MHMFAAMNSIGHTCETIFSALKEKHRWNVPTLGLHHLRPRMIWLKTFMRHLGRILGRSAHFCYMLFRCCGGEVNLLYSLS